MSLSESFDPDDQALIDRFPDYPPQTDIIDRPPTPTREISSLQRPSKKKQYLSRVDRRKIPTNINICSVHEEITSIRLSTPCNPRKGVYNLIEVISNEPNK
jgi:hypothetical protein